MGLDMSQIITTDSLCAFMGKKLDNDQAQSAVNAINQWIETYTGRCWGEQKAVTERYDWAPRIWLRHQDIDTSDGSMTIKLGYPNLQQSTLDKTSFFWNEWGRVTMYLQAPFQFNPSPVNNDLVQITYKYGVKNVPDDLTAAALGIAATMYNWASENDFKTVSEAAVGSYRLRFGGGHGGASSSPTGTGKTYPSNDPALANYLTIDMYVMRRS